MDIIVGVGTQSGRLTRKAELEAPAAGARPSPDERDCGIRAPALGASDGLLGDSRLLGALGLGKPCALTDGAKQVTRHFGLPVRELAPASQRPPLDEGTRPTAGEVWRQRLGRFHEYNLYVVSACFKSMVDVPGAPEWSDRLDSCGIYF